EGWRFGAGPDNSFLQSGGRLGYDVVDHGLEVAGAFPDGQLAVGAGAVLQDLVDIAHLLAAPELVDLAVDELEQLEDERVRVHLLLLAEVDELSGDAVARGDRKSTRLNSSH